MNSERIISTTEAGSLDDEMLWGQFKSGNELAFSVLYKRHVNRLFNYGMHTCRDKELVKDCLQELFTRLWSKRETLGVAGSVNYYLFKSFRRLLISRLIANRKFALPFHDNPDSMFEFIPSIEDTMIAGEAKKQQLEQLKVSFNALTKRQREAIFLKFFNELSYHEVSSIMEVHVDSVYNLISKALTVLKKKLKDNPSF
ncbi:MAG: sigma-70 family RNA polymerase sigma factor [Imperialibacter sp.]|uniref:RNA polymerase sigma factor n=1 Tax=Imperialibacter sp. TaxID=2038411 RepID=UPI0032EAF264